MKKRIGLSAIAAGLLFTLTVHSAPLIRTQGVGGGTIQSMVVSGAYLIAGAQNGGFFRSADNGATWAADDSGLTNKMITSMAVCGSRTFAGTGQGNPTGLFRSSDNGASWTQISSTAVSGQVNAVVAYPPMVLAGTGAGVYLSSDSGQTWVLSSIGTSGWGTMTPALLKFENLLFASNGQQYGGQTLYASADTGKTWKKSDSGFSTSYSVNALIALGSKLFAATNSGIYVSNDTGKFWTSSGGMTLKYATVTTLYADGTMLYCGTNGMGVFATADTGATWNQKGLAGGTVYCLCRNGSSLFAGTYGSGIYLAVTGMEWDARNNGLYNATTTCMTTIGNCIVAGTDGAGLYRSSNHTSWMPVDSGLRADNYLYANDLYALGGRVFASTLADGNRHLDATIDTGKFWKHADSGYYSVSFNCVGSLGRRLFGGATKGMYVSTDFGVTWDSTDSGIPMGSGYGMPARVEITAIQTLGNTVLAGTSGAGVCISSDSGASWDTAALKSSLFKSQRTRKLLSFRGLVFSAGDHGIFVSRDTGKSWDTSCSGIFIGPGAPGQVTDLVARESTLYAATIMGLFQSADSGASWTAVDAAWNGLHEPFSLAVLSDTLYAGTYFEGIWKMGLPRLETPAIAGRSEKSRTKSCVYRNVNGIGFVSLSVPNAGTVAMKMYDLRGRQVFASRTLSSRAGDVTVAIPAGISNVGTCVLEIEAPHFKDRVKLSVFQ